MRFKKFMAAGMALTLSMAMCTVAFAADVTAPVTSETVTGDGSISGYIDKNVYRVNVPATPSVGFKIDPQELLGVGDTDFGVTDTTGGTAVTDYKGSLLFGGTGSKYTTNSDTINVINKSSIKVDVNVSAKVTGLSAEGANPYSINLVETIAADSTANDLSMTLSSTKGTTTTDVYAKGADDAVTTAITDVTNGNNHDTVILDDIASEYEITKTGSDYAYTLKAAADGFPTASFALSGAVNADSDWKAFYEAQKASTADLGVTLVYSINEHVDGPSVSVSSAGKITISNLTSAKNLAEVSDIILIAGSVEYPCDSTFGTVDTTAWTEADGGTVIFDIVQSSIDFMKGESSYGVKVNLIDGTSINAPSFTLD